MALRKPLYQSPEFSPDQIEAILFDLDGTLVDTDDLAVERISRRLSPFLGRRAAPVTRWLLMQAETPGNSLITLLDMLHLDHKLRGLVDRLGRWRGVYPAKEFRLIPGVKNMVLALQPHYRMALVTTRTRYHIEEFLFRFPAIGTALEVSCGAQDTRRLKPHPEPVLLAARELGAPPERCLMVGDTTVDIRSGRRAGAWTAGVLCGFGRRHELARAGAHLILANTADLLMVLNDKAPSFLE